MVLELGPILYSDTFYESMVRDSRFGGGLRPNLPLNLRGFEITDGWKTENRWRCWYRSGVRMNLSQASKFDRKATVLNLGRLLGMISEKPGTLFRKWVPMCETGACSFGSLLRYLCSGCLHTT